MKKLLLLITFLLSIACANAQSPTFQWVKGTGATSKISVYSGNSIAVDAAGNVYTTGCFIGTVDFDPGAGTYNLTSDTTDNIFISKLDASGNFVWAKEMSGTGSSNSGAGTSIVVDATGNVYTTGCFSGTIDFDPGVGIVNLTSGLGGQETFISKLDASGNFVWAKKISGAGSGDSSFGNSIAIDAADNVYTTGSFQGTIDFDPGAGTFDITSGVGGMDIFISKLDASGSFVWAKQMPCAWGASGNAGSIAIDAAGKIYTTGYFHGTIDFDPGAGTFNLNAINTDIFISKLDASGNFVWAKNMGGSGSSDSGYGSSIAVDSADNVYSMGYFYGTVDFDPGVGIDSLTAVGTTNMFVSKLDAYGDFVWAKNIGGSATSYSQGYSLALDIADNVYTTGAFIGTVDFDPGAGIDSLTSNTSGDIFISKLDGSGNFVWAVQMGGASSYIQGCSITVD
ncbi:MAG: SBBP repeat-containing protein, partial [Bacteroidia bacterium]